MRTMTQIALVLMGGGVLTGGVAASMAAANSDCAAARARQDPRAAEICRSSGSHFYGAHVWFGGGGRWASYAERAVGTGARAVVRGGFGLTGLHFGGFHG